MGETSNGGGGKQPRKPSSVLVVGGKQRTRGEEKKRERDTHWPRTKRIVLMETAGGECFFFICKETPYVFNGKLRKREGKGRKKGGKSLDVNHPDLSFFPCKYAAVYQ